VGESRRGAVARSAAVGVLLLGLAGCAMPGAVEGPSRTAEGPGRTAEGPSSFAPDELPEVSRAEEYRRLSELAADASDVVVVDLDPDAETTRDAAGFRFVPMVVVDGLAGSLAAGDRVVVRTDVPLPGDSEGALLESGRTYLLYLAPLELGDGVVHDEMVVVGYLAGYFEQTADGDFHKIDPEGVLAGERFTYEDFVESVRAS